MHKFNADFGKRCDNADSRAKVGLRSSASRVPLANEALCQVVALPVVDKFNIRMRIRPPDLDSDTALGTRSVKCGVWNANVNVGHICRRAPHEILCISVLAFVAVSLRGVQLAHSGTRACDTYV